MPKDVKSKVTAPKTVLDKVGYSYMYLVFSLSYFHFVYNIGKMSFECKYFPIT